MIQKSILLSMLCLSTINSLHASPLTNLIHPQQKLHHIQEHLKNNLANEGYTDFTGTWESVKCMGQPMTLEIENSDKFFTINNEEPMIIGTMSTRSDSGTKGESSILASNETISIEWNDLRTQLIVKQVSIKKSFIYDYTSNSSETNKMHLEMNHIILEMDKDQLTMKFNNAEYEDLQRVDASHPTCVFNKKVDA